MCEQAEGLCIKIMFIMFDAIMTARDYTTVHSHRDRQIKEHAKKKLYHLTYLQS